MGKQSKKELTIVTRKQQFRQLFNMFNIENLTFDDHMQLYRWHMKTLGLNCLSENYFKSGYQVYGLVTFLYTVFFTISGIYFIKRNMNDMSKVTECLTTRILAVALMVKITLFVWYRNEISGMIDTSRELFNETKAGGGKPWSILLKRLKEARIVTRLMYYATIIVATTFISCTLPKYESKVLPLAAPLLGLTSDETPYYQINFAKDVWAMFVASHLMTGYESIYIYFLLVLSAHIEILIHKLEVIGKSEEFFDDADAVESDEGTHFMNMAYTTLYLKECIRVHQKIFEFGDYLNQVYKLDCLSEVILSTMVGCVSLYQVTESTTGTVYAYYLYIICCIVQIFIYCWYGDLIHQKSLAIAEVVYDCPWHRFHPSQRNTIQVMLMRSQKPINISAVFTNLTLECFTSVMRATYSFYTVLTTVDE